MVAADVKERVYEWAHAPYMEVVTLTVSDGETYVSTKFKTILAAVATSNEDDDAEINVTFSGQTATINWASVTDKAMTLILFGQK